MSQSTSSSGRPRSDKTRHAILAAAFDLLAERGYAGMSLDAVATSAGAGKTTIYRWWKNKAELAVEAFFDATKAALIFPDTRRARDDFREQIVQLAEIMRGPRGAVFAAMLGGARTDADLAKALGALWLEPRRKWGFERMTRAIEAQECHDGVEPFAALGLLYGPLYAPLLFGEDLPSQAQVEAHLRLALPAIFKV